MAADHIAESTPVPRRELFARALLLGDPYKLGTLSGRSGEAQVDFDSVAAAKAWMQAAGLDGQDEFLSGSEYVTEHTDGITRCHFNAYPTWLGWKMYIIASEPVTASSELDEDTAARLRVIAGGVDA